MATIDNVNVHVAEGESVWASYHEDGWVKLHFGDDVTVTVFCTQEQAKEILPAHQPREHAVNCPVCQTPTWALNGMCTAHVHLG